MMPNALRSKKGTETKMLWLAVEITLMVVVAVALMNMLNAMVNPDKQVSYSNAEILRTSMERACLSDEPVVVENVEFPQPSPSKLWGATDMLPRLSIQMSGDPHYIIYYESFPAGEAIGWEVYPKMNHRVVAPLPRDVDGLEYGGEQCPADGKITMCEVENFIAKVKKEAAAEIESPGSSAAEPVVVIPNIILDDAKKGKIADAEKPYNLPGSAGKWQDSYEEGKDNYYAFSNYMMLSTLDKSLIKYRSCGENSLCFKTRDGVYSLPLEACKNKIDYVELNYNSRDYDMEDVAGPAGGAATATIGPRIASIMTKIPIAAAKIAGSLGTKVIPVIGWIWAGGAAAKMTLTVIARYKVSDFYMASPCEMPTKIEIEYLDGVSDGCICKNMLTYPLYKYDASSGLFVVAGEKKTCLDSIGGDVESSQDVSIGEKVPCLRVNMQHSGRKEKFCWTSNPNTVSYNDWGDASDSLTEAAAYIGGLPVRESTAFIPDENAVVLKPTGSGTQIDNYRDSFWNNLAKGWSWQWPAGV